MSKNVEALLPTDAEWSRGNFRPKFNVYDGKVVRLEVFADRRRALESVGLTEAKTPFSGGP